MTSEELTGILQSRGQEEGQSYAVIDGQRLNCPDYVVDWMAKMQRPLQNGETVLYKKAQDREGGAWHLTKIRRPPKETKGSPAGGPPQVDQKGGVLLSHYPTGCVVRMSNGDKTYALKAPLPKDIELPQKMEFTVDKQGFILGHRFYGKADIALQENLDRLNGPADGETAEPPGGPLPALPVNDVGMCTLTIGGTINLQNYENLKVEISGPAAYRREMIMYLNDTLELFGQKEPTTGGMIDAWKNRVLGGVADV